VFKMSEVGVNLKIHPDQMDFYTCFLDFIYMICGDKNYDFLSMKMSEEEMYNYLLFIHRRLKAYYLLTNKRFTRYLDLHEDINWFF